MEPVRWGKVWAKIRFAKPVASIQWIMALVASRA